MLVFLAIAIVGFSLWYSGKIVRNIRQEERQKVRLWSRAIQERARLVNYTKELFRKLRKEERKKVELWAEATKRLAGEGRGENYTFLLKVVQNNTTVPVILTDEEGEVISSRNLDPERKKDSAYLHAQIQRMEELHEPIEIQVVGDRKHYLYYKNSRLFEELKDVMDGLIESFISETVINTASVPVILTDSTRSEVVAFGNIDSSVVEDSGRRATKLAEMKAANPPIEVDMGGGRKHYVFYEPSWVITQLQYYPYIQFGVIALFLLIAYFLFSTFRKAEQNQVWLGMAKETAHQLGTPLSSLMAWLDLLKAKEVEPQITRELEKDVDRLGTITDRFSKIGSDPELERVEIAGFLNESVEYLRSRVSKKVNFEVVPDEDKHLKALLNKPLFSWVIENLCKNSVDAMQGEGSIQIRVTQDGDRVNVDLTDTGKGIPRSQHKSVFEPGYSTKELGWGLGLSLTKRIVENYLQGQVFIKWSEPGKGTTFRIVLKK